MTDLEKYYEINEELKMYNYASFIISYDGATICPKLDKKMSYKASDYYSMKYIEITKSDEYYDILKRLLDNKEVLNVYEFDIISKEYEDLTKERLVPNDVVFKGMELFSKSNLDWEEARDTLDFSKFESDLDNVINYYINDYIPYKEGKYHGYGVLLDEMEDDFTEEMYDNFFNTLKVELIPILKKCRSAKKKYNEKIKTIKFDIDRQKHITQEICNMMGYTKDVGCVAETIHPFSNTINKHDARVTTNYDEEKLFSNIYSVMHEIGHSLYELGIDDRYDGSILMGGASCAIHESQSRFYENYLGRSREFIEFLYPILLKYYSEELKEFSVDDIYYYCNDVTDELIRCDADELSYPFHIIVRYECEKALFHKEIKTSELSDYFNEKMKEYLDLYPTNKKNGAFQDVHWTSSFGYFPTYALGSAFGAQFYHAMERDLDIKGLMKVGNFKPITKWLNEHIHQYGRTKKNLELVRSATGEDFNPTYYVNYLKEKFKEFYED